MSGNACPRFVADGETFEAQYDATRLGRQHDAVAGLMRDGAWRTLAEIAAAVRAPEASISARLRDLRKARFGGWDVQRRRRGEETRGLYEYRVQPPKPLEQQALPLGEVAP